MDLKILNTEAVELEQSSPKQNESDDAKVCNFY